MKNGLPELSHLQYAVIETLGEETVNGKVLQMLIRQRTRIARFPKVQFFLTMCSLVAIGAVRAVPGAKGGWPDISYTRTSRGHILAIESYKFYNAKLS